MELDIVFNIDYSTNNGVSPLYADVPMYIEYLEVNNMEQFTRLVDRLSDNVNCYIWAHPSFSATMVQSGSSSHIVNRCVPELHKLGIDVTEITRSTDKTTEQHSKYLLVGKMLDVRSGKKSYTPNELKTLLSPPRPAVPAEAPRPLLEELFKEQIGGINDRLNKLQGFLGAAYGDFKAYWYNGIFEIDEAEANQIFNFPYWKFSAVNFKKFLNLTNLDQPLLEKEEINVAEIVKYDAVGHKWMIDISFYNEVSRRFEKQGNNYKERLAIATTLYVIHEAVHKVHHLDCNTVNGIGNFPRIIEEADYQADTIAILMELAFFIHEMGGVGQIKPEQLLKKLSEIIQIAIETTFSFNPLEVLRLIQVRRVNRYLIWFYHYFKIMKYHEDSITTVELLHLILVQFAVKPMIEITGPAIKSSAGRDRTFYDFDDIRHIEEVGVLKVNNEIVRMGKLQSINFKDFYDGIRESKFEKMYKFLSVLFDNNKTAMD